MARIPIGELGVSRLGPHRRELVLGSLAAATASCATTAKPPALAPGQDYRVVQRPVRDTLGEGITWSPRRNAIFWVDIERPTLWMMSLSTGAIRSWPVPETICWIVERQGREDFIVGVKRGFAVLTLEPFTITPFANPEPDLPNNRLNDAKVHPSGRIYANTTSNGQRQAASIYRIDTDLSFTKVDTGYHIGNGPTFSPDGRVMYHADSFTRIVYAYDVRPNGDLANKRVFTRYTSDVPDGMTTDADGGVWIAHWDGGKISRWTPDGRLDRSITLPALRPTDPVFVGPRLDRMFVTSAGPAASGRSMGAEAGALFEVRPGVRGLPTTPFKG